MFGFFFSWNKDEIGKHVPPILGKHRMRWDSQSLGYV